jgi:hypothetical protein
VPVRGDLARSDDDNRRHHRPQRTPTQRGGRRLALRRRWFPDRRFVRVGDAGYGRHALARCGGVRRDRRTRLRTLHPEANRFEPPPPDNGKERPRLKGPALPPPAQAVTDARRRRRRLVDGYGGGRRRVAFPSGTAAW